MLEEKQPEELNKRTEKIEATILSVRVQQPQRDCARYTWNHEQGCLQFAGIYHAHTELPANMAILRLDGQSEIAVLLVSAYSFPPETLVSARLLGSLQYVHTQSGNKPENTFPLADCTLIAVPVQDDTYAAIRTLEMLPSNQLMALQHSLSAQQTPSDHKNRGIRRLDASTTLQKIREARLYLKRQQREKTKSKSWLRHDEEEAKTVAWRAIEGIPDAVRLQLQRDRKLQADPNAPHAQAEMLIRFVPKRFQDALQQLLLDDERLLAFMERPLLQQRSGLLGVQTWRANEGLFLVTDRQILWLRDFFTPRQNALPGGYIAHSLPLERLSRLTIFTANSIDEAWATRFPRQPVPYPQLALDIASSTGHELFTVAFPTTVEAEKALAHIHSILQRFLSYEPEKPDRRLLRVPFVEPYMPLAHERSKLEGLGGNVMPETERRLETTLARLKQTLADTHDDELLVSALIPTLEEYHSPARIVALSRQKLFVLDEQLHHSPSVQISSYGLHTLTSAQLRYSLLGSNLSIFIPHQHGQKEETQQISLPFHSPAITLFLPLFQKLRLLLTIPPHGHNPERGTL